MSSASIKKPTLANIILPCVIGGMMFTINLHSYAILQTGNSKFVRSYYENKPLFVIGFIETYIVPVLVLLQILKLVFVDLLSVCKGRARMSNYFGFLFPVILAFIIAQMIPLTKLEEDIMTLDKSGILKCAHYQGLVCVGNAMMLSNGIGGYIINLREYNNEKFAKVAQSKKQK